MTVLAFTAIVVETWWVIAIVGAVHVVGSGVLMVLLIRQLQAEERASDDADAPPNR